MKRAAFLMIAVGSVFANAGPADAVAVAGVAISYAQKRMATDLADALSLIASSTAATLNDNYKEALQPGPPGVPARVERSAVGDDARDGRQDRDRGHPGLWRAAARSASSSSSRW